MQIVDKALLFKFLFYFSVRVCFDSFEGKFMTLHLLLPVHDVHVSHKKEKLLIHRLDIHHNIIKGELNCMNDV